MTRHFSRKETYILLFEIQAFQGFFYFFIIIVKYNIEQETGGDCQNLLEQILRGPQIHLF